MQRNRPTRKSGSLYKSQLQIDLVAIAKQEMDNGRVGYSTLAKLIPGCTRDTVRRAFGTKEAKLIDVEFVMRILHALGYDIEVRLKKRNKSERENESVSETRKRLSSTYQQPDYSKDRVFTVRRLVGSERLGRRATPIRAVVERIPSQGSRQKLPNSATVASSAD